MRHVAFISFLFFPGISVAQFSDVSAELGSSLINYSSMFGSGTSFADFDGNGWCDLTFASSQDGVRFYQNNNGIFGEFDATFNPPIPTDYELKGVIWMDYDNDGDKDLFISGMNVALMLYKNEGGNYFTDVASSIGILPEIAQMTGISAGDINNDGCLDLYISKYHNQFVTGYQYSNRVYLNNCNGTFSDITIPAGFGNSIQASFASLWIDYDKDGDQDVYVINDRYNYPNYVYRNNGNNTFSNVTASSGGGVYIDAMSATAGDYDNDSDLDLYISNSPSGNVLLNYNSLTQFFADVGAAAGVTANALCWAAMWLDYDNDSWLDLFVSTLGSVGTTEYQNLFYVSNHNGTFHLGLDETGIEGDLDGTYTCAMGDYNHDGYYDYATNNVAPSENSLWLNSGGTNHWVTISVEGTLSNRDGIGTWIECHSGTQHLTAYTFCGENYLGQNSEDKIFGLGNLTVVDSVEISWLSGLHETYYNLAADARYHFIEGQSISLIPATIAYDGDLFLCSGESITLVASPAQSYYWSNGETSQSIVVNTSGNYSVTVTDALGFNHTSDTLFITLFPDPEYSLWTNNVSCYGGSDGAAHIEFEDSDAYLVSWQNNSMSSSISGLPQGEYSYSITGTGGCIVEGMVSIVEPSPLTGEIETTDVLCWGENSGSAYVQLEGGTPPYLEEWNTLDPLHLLAGTHPITIVDSLGCTLQLFAEILEPEVLAAEIFTTDAIPGGLPGSAEAFISGGTPPYHVSWSTMEDGVMEIHDLFPGIYSADIEDFNACSLHVEFEIVQQTGIFQVPVVSGIHLFPNPLETALHVSYQTSSEVAGAIRDVCGRCLVEFVLTPGNSLLVLPVDHLSSGLYVFCLQGFEGMNSTKLIKR